MAWALFEFYKYKNAPVYEMKYSLSIINELSLSGVTNADVKIIFISSSSCFTLFGILGDIGGSPSLSS